MLTMKMKHGFVFAFIATYAQLLLFLKIAILQFHFQYLKGACVRRRYKYGRENPGNDRIDENNSDFSYTLLSTNDSLKVKILVEKLYNF